MLDSTLLVGNSPVDTVDPSGLNGFVITQRRRIVYREDGVQKVTDDMKYVDKARKKGATIDITYDETVADIIYSPKLGMIRNPI